MRGMFHRKLKRNIGKSIKLIPIEYCGKIFIGFYGIKNYNSAEREHKNKTQKLSIKHGVLNV